MSATSADPRQRAEAVLAQVGAIEERCLVGLEAWKATPEDALVLNEASLLIGRSLPREVFTSPPAALAFMQMVKAALDDLLEIRADGDHSARAVGKDRRASFGSAALPAALRASLGDFWMPLTIAIAVALLVGLAAIFWWRWAAVTPCCDKFWPTRP
jgi:hypothetical protein